jgi:hypothetical protein
MFEKYNSSGYDLYQPFENIDQWVIDDHNQAYHGSLREVCQYMIKKLDFNFQDIEDGLMLLADYAYRGDNACHFGIYRTCIYTYDRDEKKGSKAS